MHHDTCGVVVDDPTTGAHRLCHNLLRKQLRLHGMWPPLETTPYDLCNRCGAAAVPHTVRAEEQGGAAGRDRQRADRWLRACRRVHPSSHYVSAQRAGRKGGRWAGVTHACSRVGSCSGWRVSTTGLAPTSAEAKTPQSASPTTRATARPPGHTRRGPWGRPDGPIALEIIPPSERMRCCSVRQRSSRWSSLSSSGSAMEIH